MMRPLKPYHTLRAIGANDQIEASSKRLADRAEPALEAKAYARRFACLAQTRDHGVTRNGDQVNRSPQVAGATIVNA